MPRIFIAGPIAASHWGVISVFYTIPQHYEKRKMFPGSPVFFFLKRNAAITILTARANCRVESRGAAGSCVRAPAAGTYKQRHFFFLLVLLRSLLQRQHDYLRLHALHLRQLLPEGVHHPRGLILRQAKTAFVPAVRRNERGILYLVFFTLRLSPAAETPTAAAGKARQLTVKTMVSRFAKFSSVEL